MDNTSYSLFIGDLSVFCTREDLKQLFSPFGLITDIRIKQDMNTGKKLSYGFVEFDNINSALNVLRTMNGYVLCGRPMRIRWGSNRNNRKPNELVKKVDSSEETSSVHVSFNVTKSNIIVTEESLRYLFSQYGFVVDVTIKKEVFNNGRGIQGYGFVHFSSTLEGIESAVHAVSGVNNVTVDGVHYRVGLSMNLERKLNDMMNQRMYGAPMMQQAPAASYYQPCMYYTPYVFPPYMSYDKNQPLFVGTIDSEGMTSVDTVSEDDACNGNSTSVQVNKTIEEPVTSCYSDCGFVKVCPIDSSSCTCTSSSCSYSTCVQSLQGGVKISMVDDLQQQLEVARNDCNSYKHSTLDIYMDVQEYVACIDLTDY